MNDINNKIIEEKDILIFDLKIKKIDDDNINLKFKNKTITIGKDELFEGIDNSLLGFNLEEEEIVNLEIKIDEKRMIFENELEEGSYIFSFKIRKLQKFNSREHIELSKMKDIHDDKHKIKELEELKNTLLAKIEKLEEEKQMTEQIFKAKVEEMAKNASNKVEILKEEIKNKAKEEIDYKAKYAIQKLVEDLLSPLNNLYIAVELGANANDPNVSAYVKGFQMLTSQIFTTLEEHGITVVEPSEGEMFNPEIHQAQELVENQMYKKDQIVKLISRGYKLNDRLLRPAIVIVAK